MEEIEYLEEYEDFILPNKTKRAEEHLDDRRSMDSLELLYKDLIGDPSGTEAAKTSISTEKKNVIANKSPLQNTMGDGLLAQSFQNQKYTNSGSTTYVNRSHTSELQQLLYKSTPNMSYVNHAENKSFTPSPAIQRSDKLKSVATVKPTLQRTYPAKKCIPNSTSHLKNTTMELSFQSSPAAPATVSTEVRNSFGNKIAHISSQSNLQNKNSITSITMYNQNQGPGVDPLSLDDQDAFLDFDADKNASDLDFESDLDNSIAVGISDMDSDSIDLSDEYSDGNFDLESDLSSDGSDVKRGMLLKKNIVQESKNKSISKPGATSAKPENKKDQTSLIKSIGSQHPKADTDQQHTAQRMTEVEKKPSQISIGESRQGAKSKAIDQKIPMKTFTPQRKLSSLNTNMPAVSQQFVTNSNSCIEKTPTILSNLKKITITPQCNIILTKKDNEMVRSATATSTKRDKLDPVSTDTKMKTLSDTSLLKSPSASHSTEHLSPKDSTTSVQIGQIKLGSQYLKSIKPPVGKVLIVNKISPKSMAPSTRKQSEQTVNQVPIKSTEVKKPTGTGEIKDKTMAKNTVPERNSAAAPCKENKVSSYNLKTAHSTDKLKTVLSEPVTTTTIHKDIKMAHKNKEIEKSDLNARLKYYSDSIEKLLNNKSIDKRRKSNQNGLKENKKRIPTTMQLVEKQLESIPKETNSRKECVSKTQPNEKTTDIEKLIPSVQCKFESRSFEIRLNKNEVAQLKRSATVPIQLRARKTISHNSATLKRKRLASSSASNSNCQSSLKSKKDQKPEIPVVCKKSKMSTDIASSASKTPESTQMQIDSTLNKRKRRKLKLNPAIKAVRSSMRSSSQTSDSTTQRTNPNESNLETKSRSKQKLCDSSTASVGHSRSSASSNLKSNGSEKPRRRVGRPIKKKNRFANKSANASRPKKLSTTSALAPTTDNSCNPKSVDQTPEVLKDERLRNENVVQSVTQCTDSTTNSEVKIIEPKREISGDSIIVHHQLELTSKEALLDPQKPYGRRTKLDGCQKKQISPTTYEGIRCKNQSLLNNNTSLSTTSEFQQNKSECTVLELPAYIVMKTKIITRQDLESSTAQIPPLVKKKIDRLAEERQISTVLKTERPDFKDICSEINALLGRNANYLKFATGSERQTRMNQVLADSSLSVEEAQSALKFLESYLSFRTKDITQRSKNQQFIPIYDSQKKIIGYRKRTIHSKRSSLPTDVVGKTVVSNRLNNSNTSNSDLMSVRTVSATMSANRTIEFTTKEEPQNMEGGDEEIIVPDVAPTTGHCIKNEVDTTNEVGIF